MFDRAATDLWEWFSGAFDLAELAKGSTANLAVTGLSRAGKTVFITSLVHNLLSALHQPYRMPFLKVVGDGRLVAARLASDKTSGLSRFPYKRNIEQMAASPANWPARTTDLSEIEIDIRFVPAGALGFLLGWIGSGISNLETQNHRLSRRMAPRSATAGPKLRRLVTGNVGALSSRNTRRHRARFHRFSIRSSP